MIFPKWCQPMVTSFLTVLAMTTNVCTTFKWLKEDFQTGRITCLTATCIFLDTWYMCIFDYNLVESILLKLVQGC
eukprot:m.222362 g.222362  ORF g.222362 m.222362 type:complete len:75 (+) comp15932_c0_seq1:282-506(+)